MFELLALSTLQYETTSPLPSSQLSSDSTGGLLFLSGVFLIYLIFSSIALLFTLIAEWKVFTKAGKPGWAAIVPIYNIIVMLEIAGRPAWWLVLFFIPIANIVAGVLLMIDFAKSFGKDTGFAILLMFLPFVGIPILAFGSAQYLGPAGPEGAGAGTATPLGAPQQMPSQNTVAQQPTSNTPPNQNQQPPKPPLVQ